MEDMLTNLTTYGYIALFIYSLGGGFVGLMAAGVLSFMGKLDLSTSIAIAFVANFLGDTLLFYMSRYHKSDVLKYLKKHRRKLALSHLLMRRHGNWIIFFQKFVYGIKTLIPLAIGITKYSFAKFSIFNLAASALWAVVVGGGSYLAGQSIVNAFAVVSDKPYIAPIVLISIAGAIWLYFSRATIKR